MISTTRATERLSQKLQRAGIDKWVGRSSGDSRGKYLIFAVGGRCICGAGGTLAEAGSTVDHLLACCQYSDFSGYAADFFGRIQYDASGAGHCWRDVPAAEIDSDVMIGLADERGEIIGGVEATVGGVNYRAIA